jgi:hypothetical protein
MLTIVGLKEMRQQMKRLLKKKLPAFSLMELAIVLVIVGIIAGSIFKGQELLEAAKLRSVLTDINRYRTAVGLYQDAFGYLPGNDPKAQERFGAHVVSGQGSGTIQGDERGQFWVHLQKAGHVGQSTPPSCKIGGNFTVESDQEGLPGNWLVLGKLQGDQGDHAILTPQQAATLKAKAQESSPNEGVLRIREGRGVAAGRCVQGEQFNLQNTQPACVVYVGL